MRFLTRLFSAISIILAALTSAVFTAIITGFVLMLLWNWLLVGATSVIGVGLPAITWLQGWGLCFLCTMLFNSRSKIGAST
ncbi:MAG: hypothetical protein A2381_15320 [Bdellovibrionales bacterium RIFOXYB1_FULL_37_110]|nr:MAG: hypothetical protein A2381_15320 [Bdellovibrionales bacterium RIFOXYB1_FULL_37_110]